MGFIMPNELNRFNSENIALMARSLIEIAESLRSIRSTLDRLQELAEKEDPDGR